jgi:dihydrofolate reductase
MLRGDDMKVTLVMALTVDGKIGKSPEHFPDWTGKEDKRIFREQKKVSLSA